jgi:regulator of replication initiation timing
MNKRTLTIIAVLLALLFLGTLVWGVTTKSRLEESYSEKDAEAEQLAVLRDKLQASVDSLGEAYTAATEENAALQGELSAAQETAQRALYDMRKAQRARKNDNDVAYQMRVQIEDLMNVRRMLETSILELTAENKDLRVRNVELRRDLSTAKTEAYEAGKEVASLSRMTETMEEDIRRMTLGAFRATAMQVDLLRKNGSATANANRARRISVSFDLTDVPTEYLGVRPIFLVLTDESATPVISENPVRATVMVNGAEKPLIALEGRDVNIERNQRISFTHELDDKLDEGFYRAEIYTDVGMLGSAKVQLR